MTVTAQDIPGVWTAVDLVERLGAIALHRVRTVPPPGSATERDVIEIHDRENRLYELLDGTLLEKTVGNYESYLAGILIQLLGNFVQQNGLGIVMPPNGMMRLAPGLVRLPDMSFISWERLPGRRIPHKEIWDLAPDLAVEVISRGNTRQEMARKLADYFSAGVRLVWYVYPAACEVQVYESPDKCITLAAEETLDGGRVLPGFRLPLSTLFAQPQ
jgi:Uma2 family endonuclease